MDLRPSQVAGRDFLSGLRHAILADDTGLGKSAQSIRAADAANAERILILCQPIGRVSWALEVPKWQRYPRPVQVFDKDTKHIPGGPLVLLAAYSSLSRAQDRKRLSKMLDTVGVFGGFDVVILDEGHHLAHPKSARTQGVYGPHGILARVEPEHVWILSATLQRGNITELYPHLKALFPAILAAEFGFVPTLRDFVDRYCVTNDTPFGTQILGNNLKTVAPLRERMRPFVLRRLKSDVAKELGAVQYVTLPLPIDPKEVQQAVANAVGVDTYLDEIDQHEGVAGILPPNVSTQWKVLGGFKIAPAVEWIEEFLDNNPDRKLVVFAHHTAVIDGLWAGLAKHIPCVIDGRTDPKRRVSEVDLFQNDPKARLFIGQTVAAGTSITLTAAHDVLMVEQEWTPADNYQAISRVHRIGQTQPVTAYIAYAAGTVDDRIAARAARKLKDFDHFFDPLTTTEA